MYSILARFWCFGVFHFSWFCQFPCNHWSFHNLQLEDEQERTEREKEEEKEDEIETEIIWYIFWYQNNFLVSKFLVHFLVSHRLCITIRISDWILSFVFVALKVRQWTGKEDDEERSSSFCYYPFCLSFTCSSYWFNSRTHHFN